MAGNAELVVCPRNMLYPPNWPAKLELVEESLMLLHPIAPRNNGFLFPLPSKSSTSASLWQTSLQPDRKGGSGKQDSSLRRVLN